MRLECIITFYTRRSCFCLLTHFCQNYKPDCVGRLYQHPLVHDFIEGKRKNVQVSFKFEGDEDMHSDLGSSVMNPYSSFASEDDVLNKFSSASSADSDFAVLSNQSSENWLHSFVRSAKGDIVTC